jgi:hypothetical protein
MEHHVIVLAANVYHQLEIELRGKFYLLMLHRHDVGNVSSPYKSCSENGSLDLQSCAFSSERPPVIVLMSDFLPGIEWWHPFNCCSSIDIFAAHNHPSLLLHET